MKKIVIIFALIALMGGAQAQTTNPINLNVVTSAVIGANDTVFYFKCTNAYTWTLHVTWASNNGTTSTITPVSSYDAPAAAASWQIYPGFSATTVSGTTGIQDFEDFFVAPNYIGIRVSKQSGKTLTITIKATLKLR